MKIGKKFNKSFSKKLVHWYENNKRDLPWRGTDAPYNIWISEAMLQQTQVETVIPYYNRFLKSFPQIKSLANADLSQVLKAWEGLGYYARARNLHKAAQIIIQNYDGFLPDKYSALLRIPGIGSYTAAAIASIAFDERHAVVDGNVSRVLSRLFLLKEPPGQNKSSFQQIATQLLPDDSPGNFNQAMMELGALVCTPKNPSCPECPVQSLCQASKTLKDPSILPVRAISKPKPHFDVVAGIIWHRGRILIDRRPLNGLLGGLWEFPGGKKENGETLEQCLKREIKEELAIQVEAGQPFITVRHEYTHFKITLYSFQCKFRGGTPKLRNAIDWKWVKPGELEQFAFPKANKRILTALLAEHGSDFKSAF